MLGIARKEFHDSIVDPVTRKRLSARPEPERMIEVKAPLINEVAVKEEFPNSHYMNPH